MPIFLLLLFLASVNRNCMQQLSLPPALLHFPSFCIPFILYAGLQGLKKDMHEWHGSKGKGITRVAVRKPGSIISWRKRIYQARRKANNSTTPLKGNIIATHFARRRRRWKAEESIMHDKSYNMRKYSCQRKHCAACLLQLLPYIMQIFEAMNTSFQLHSCSTCACHASIY